MKKSTIQYLVKMLLNISPAKWVMKKNEVMCYVDDIDVTWGFVEIFNKGAPLSRVLTDLFENIQKQDYLEKYWSFLKLRQLLKSNRNISSKYFVFEMEHVLPIFIFLYISWSVCSIIF